jgi:hypothetical protein
MNKTIVFCYILVLAMCLYFLGCSTTFEISVKKKDGVDVCFQSPVTSTTVTTAVK